MRLGNSAVFSQGFRHGKMNTSTVEFSTTSKGKRLLIIDGNAYTLNKDRGGMKYWRCKERTCPATVHTDGNDHIVSHSSDHNHFATPEHIELLQFRHEVKRRVLAESIPIGRIYDEELANASLSLPALSMALTSKEAREYLKTCCNSSIYLLIFTRIFVSSLTSENYATAPIIKWIRNTRSIQEHARW